MQQIVPEKYLQSFIHGTSLANWSNITAIIFSFCRQYVWLPADRIACFDSNFLNALSWEAAVFPAQRSHFLPSPPVHMNRFHHICLSHFVGNLETSGSKDPKKIMQQLTDFWKLTLRSLSAARCHRFARTIFSVVEYNLASANETTDLVAVRACCPISSLHSSSWWP